jgi:hypothetical protein
MSGSLAQLIALISFGNAFLMMHNVKDLGLENSTFKYCNSVTFFGAKNGGNQVVVAKNIQGWFAYLKENKCKKMKLFYKPSGENKIVTERETTGFIDGGGVWMIEAVYSTYSDYWIADEQVTNEHSKDNRIWSVKYTLALSHQLPSRPTVSLNEANANLTLSLNKIAAFASKHKLSYWTKVFEKAKQNLVSAHPTVDYYKDFIIEKNHPLPSQQVLFSASRAWVFGGMGSWNDMAFDEASVNETYNKLSDSLYHSVIQATLVGINI